MPFVIRSDCRPDTPNRLLNFALHLPDCRRQKQPFPVAPAIQPERRTTMANNGVNDDRGNNVAVAIRLRIVDGKIAEIEQLAIRPPVQLGGRGGRAGAAAGAPGTGDRVVAMKEPNPIFSAVIPENERGVARGSDQYGQLLLHRARPARWQRLLPVHRRLRPF